MIKLIALEVCVDVSSSHANLSKVTIGLLLLLFSMLENDYVGLRMREKKASEGQPGLDDYTQCGLRFLIHLDH